MNGHFIQIDVYIFVFCQLLTDRHLPPTMTERKRMDLLSSFIEQGTLWTL